MTKSLGTFKICISNQTEGFRPERPGYFSPGQSFRRNDRNDALGNEIRMQTVREGKILKATKIFRTELYMRNQKKRETNHFVRKSNCTLKNVIVRTILAVRIQPRALPGAIIIYPFQGKEEYPAHNITEP
jgi:hypothetical protein